MPRPHLGLVFPVRFLDPARVVPGGTRPEPVYYGLPRSLLDSLDPILKPVAATDLWARDRELAVDPDGIGPVIGYVGGGPLVYEHLHDPIPLRLSAADAATLGMSTAAAARFVAVANRRLEAFRASARAYCGWLLTNPEFLREHDEILSRWAGIIRTQGLPEWIRLHTERVQFGVFAPEGSVPADMATEFTTWLLRWRLAGLTAPYLPRPLMPQAPAPAALRNPAAGGATLFLPDTFPVPGRDELRHLMEDILRGTPSPHLTEWHTLVGADNRAKGRLDRYARLFVLQHYWAVLHHRYGSILRRRVTVLKAAFARFLVGSHPGGVDTVHKDLLFISRRLGAKWCTPATAPVD
jgi:hypothetical protein